MLTPEYLDGLPEPILELYAQAEDDILSDMARRISSYNYWIPSADWQNQKLLEAGRVQEEIIRILAEKTGRTEAELKQLMQQAANDGLRIDKAIYQEAGRTVPPLADNEALRAILNAGYRATAQTMKNITRTTARTASQQFERVLDEAWMKVTSGAFSTDEAVRSAVKELSVQGVKSIQYASGREDSLEATVRRAVVTGVNQTCGKLQLELAVELGCDLMEITAHAGARPSHAVWQGQIVSRSGQAGYLTFEDIGYGTVGGFKGANCRHDWNPYFEGMPRTWTEEKLRELNEPRYTYNGKQLTEYEAQQTQRHHERQIRRWKREYVAMKAAGQDTTEASVKLKQWQDRQKDFLSQTGLKRQSGRESLAGFGKSEARKSAVIAKRELEKYSAYHYNKDETIIVTDDWTQREHSRVPAEYKPFAVVDTVSRGGKQRDRTYFDAEGRQIRQVSNGPHGNLKMHPYGENGEHVHDIVWQDGTIADRPIRDLNDAERKENADIL